MSAIRHTVSFTAAGTIDSFDTAGVQAGLRSYLQCFEPNCTLVLRVTQGSVNVEAVVTDTGGGGSSTATVEAAAALSRESEAGLFKALGVTVQGAVTASAPSNIMVQISSLTRSPPPPSSESEMKAVGPDVIDVDSDEESVGLIVGAIVGCLILLVALGAGGGYCYKKRKRPAPPVVIEISRSPIDVHVHAGIKEETKPIVAPKSLTAVLASCGLEHRAKCFEDEGHTLEIALKFEIARSSLGKTR